MSIFLKTVAGVLVALILWISLSGQKKEFSVLLTMTICAMIVTVFVSFIQPVIDFVKKIQDIGNIDTDLLSVVIRAVGIGVTAEIAALICKDAGNETMGKALQLLSTAVILWMSIPVFEKLLSLLDKILGTL